MALYTGKGDDGKTKTFGCNQKISKSSITAEALGALDEINSFLGLAKVKSQDDFKILDKSFVDIVAEIQQNLFIIQAEVAGADMAISEEKLRECENYVNEAEKILPPIKTFFISGGTELASIFDISRTIARRAERRVVAMVEEDFSKNVSEYREKVGMSEVETEKEFGKWSLAYLNRLSSLLYALARLSNHYLGIKENAPSYK